MANYDLRMIDPTHSDLARALGRAMRAANAGDPFNMNQMTRNSGFWDRFARDVLRSGPDGRRRSCKGGRVVPEVVVGWWTDPAGRKHMRVLGRTRSRHARMRPEGELRELPPWWHVYPETVIGVRGIREGARYLAVCRCGAIGAPGALGWMGDTCGPCFDRRADGGTPTGGFGQFHGWAPNLARFTFTSDGQHLIGQNRTGGFWKVDRGDGRAIIARKKSVNQLAATGRSEEGISLALQEGTVLRWRADRDALELVLPGRQMWGRVAMPPNGSRVALVSYLQAFVADLRVPQPKYTSVQTSEMFTAFQFAPDASRLLVATGAGEISSVDPQTMAQTVLRRDALQRLPGPMSTPLELAVAADGASVLVRREWYGRNQTNIRHIPLPAGKVVELKLPEWHHPTALGYSPDGRQAITADTFGGWVGFWDVATGESLGFVSAILEDLARRSGPFEFAPDARALAVPYSSGQNDHGSTIAIWPWPDVLTAAASG